MLHILLADASGDPKRIREAEKRVGSVRWRVPKRARAGDPALLCYTDEPKRFVAEASVLSDPEQDLRRSGWYWANIGKIRPLHAPVPISHFLSHQPAWGWLTYPRSYTSVDGRVERGVREAIAAHQSASSRAGESEIEDKGGTFNSFDRWEPESARAVIENLLGCERSSIQAFLRILAFDIDTFSLQRRDNHWGLSLFSNALRLNVGWVECVILGSRGVRLLVATAKLPRGFRTVSRNYVLAPGCALVALESGQVATLWPRVKAAHTTAIEIAGRRSTHKSIRDAHSPGVIAYASRQLGRELRNPTYYSDLGRVSPNVAGPDMSPVPDPDEYYTAVEGGRLLVEHLRIERNRRIIEMKRSAVLDMNGCLRCEICDFDFAEHFGSRGRGFCEVHHLQPLSRLDKGVRSTRLEDLAIVCSNCHKMLHRQPILTPKQLRAVLDASSSRRLSDHNS